MIYQKCEKCESEWNAIKNVQECPFCGNVFEIQTSNFKNIEDAFKYIFDSRGLEIIKHKKEFLSLLADYAPTLEKERRAIGMALDSGVYLELLTVDKTDTASQNTAKAKAVGKLNTEFLMDSTQASYAVSWFVSQLGWNSLSPVQKEKKFIPCNVTSSSAINCNEVTPVVEQKNSVAMTSFPKIVVGEKTSFGRYAFEADGTQKPIEWEILDVQKEKILLWSTMCIDVYPYNIQRNEKCDWYHSDLRKYIRKNIFIKAFNHREKAAIITTEIKPSYNPNSKICYGKDEAFDKIFILSDEEFDQYQLRSFQLKGAATPFAKTAGISTVDGDAYYWVRTPGSSYETQMFVGKDGQRNIGGNYVDIASRGIRPAVWVDYDKFFKLKMVFKTNVM